jgi:hypothetical protein
MDEECCAGCVHFKSDPAIMQVYGPDVGLCGFGPPVVAAVSPPEPPVHPPVWPVVHKSHWCPAFRQSE